MRKSAAITASPSTTRLTARLSATNQAGKSSAMIRSAASASAASMRTSHEVTTRPGAATSQSAGKSANISPENGGVGHAARRRACR